MAHNNTVIQADLLAADYYTRRDITPLRQTDYTGHLGPAPLCTAAGFDCEMT